MSEIKSEAKSETIKYERYHCWHGIDLLRRHGLPPMRQEVCCHCGAKRILEPHPKLGHGPYIPAGDALYIWTAADRECIERSGK